MSKATEHAERIGREHGVNAAEWWAQSAVGSRATGDMQETAKRVLAGIDDGDPQILDDLPTPDLSGQWSDGYSSQDLYDEIDADHEWQYARFTSTKTCTVCGLLPFDSDDEELSCNDESLCDAYDNAFNEAAENEVRRICSELIA
jgi:hypothetical protein